MREEQLWVEKYRPNSIADTILPSELQSTFATFVQQRFVPNLLLTGKPGVGKTTVAKAMLKELDCSYIVINGSLHGNIDTLRNDIQNFASSMSLMGGRKYVILDEADHLNPNSTQPALRNFMEEYSKNCGFILTCNFKNKILDALQSRCSVIDFSFRKDQLPKLAKSMFERICFILDQEGVKYDSRPVMELVAKYFPDNRRIINELQRYSANGKIDSGILANKTDSTFKSLIESLKSKKFTEVRKWVGENSDVDSVQLYREIYNHSTEYMESSSIPQLVLILADYQHRAAFVADPEINNTACLVEIMAGCSFK